MHSGKNQISCSWVSKGATIRKNSGLGQEITIIGWQVDIIENCSSSLTKLLHECVFTPYIDVHNHGEIYV